MSEAAARKYTSIHNLREEIRQDMHDYKLSYSREQQDGQFLFNSSHDRWFTDFLEEQIIYKIMKLKELVEQNNE